MSAPRPSALERLVHDVRSRSSSLREAAALLKSASPAEERELLGLMADQAELLARALRGRLKELDAR